MARLKQRMQRDQEAVRKIPEEWEDLLIDSHFHLDRMVTHEQFKKCKTLTDIENEVSHLAKFGMGVANFCDPNTWFQINQWIKTDLRIVYTIGLHPSHLTSSPVTEQELAFIGNCLGSPHCKGLGEIGLDFKYAKTQHQVDMQRNNFMDILRSAPLHPRHVVVLHLRSQRGWNAYQEGLKCIITLQKQHHKFHVHCFDGGYQDVQDWLRECPNTMFGITGLVTVESNMRDAAKFIPTDRLLLESDSPHLPPTNHSIPNNPWLLTKTTYSLSHIKNLEFPVMRQILNANVVKCYNLK